MVTLRRTVRFSLPPPGSAFSADAARHNAYGGWPSACGISVFGAIDVVVCGEPDPRTGYLINISEIDRAVRDAGIPWLHAEFERQAATRHPVEPVSTLPGLTRRIASQLQADVRRVTWHVTPFHHVSYEPRGNVSPTGSAHGDQRMNDLVELSQQFDFSASHRLHCPEYDDATNRRVFGKCNNPNGHGHNYRIEVTVRVPLVTPPPMTLIALERIVDETVISRFDHRHLNTDCPEFASLNPSVEHIAKVCYDLLAAPVANAGGTLRHVTVWETEKTACTYPANATN